MHRSHALIPLKSISIYLCTLACVSTGDKVIGSCLRYKVVSITAGSCELGEGAPAQHGAVGYICDTTSYTRISHVIASYRVHDMFILHCITYCTQVNGEIRSADHDCFRSARHVNWKRFVLVPKLVI